MSEFDGPTLRSVRESVKVPLRRVARLAAMSHGHLSKVERGEHGRPVTPAVLAAYERATGVRLSDAKIIGFEGGSGDTSGAGWRRGRLSDARRRGFNAQVASVAIGGPVGEPVARMLDALGRMSPPNHVGVTDAGMVEDAAQLLTDADLRWGGGLASQLARTVLRWAVGLSTASMTTPVRVRLLQAIGQLAHRGGWAAFDADAHDAARSLFLVALDAAIQAGDRDLRAHVLADVAAQHTHLGYPDDALEIVGMVEGDQQISPMARMVLCGVKARAHAAAGQADQCRAYIELVETCHQRAGNDHRGGWLASVCTKRHRDALTGHAAAILAHHSGEQSHWHDAQLRLTSAADVRDVTTYARAVALCAARLAVLHLDVDDHDTGIGWARRVLAAAPGLRSARVARHLKQVRATAAAKPDVPALKQLVADIDTTLTPPADAQTGAGPSADTEKG